MIRSMYGTASDWVGSPIWCLAVMFAAGGFLLLVSGSAFGAITVPAAAQTEVLTFLRNSAVPIATTIAVGVTAVMLLMRAITWIRKT